MKITSVRYERLHSFGNYENEKLSAEAVIADGDDPDEAADQLRHFIDGQIETALLS